MKQSIACLVLGGLVVGCQKPEGAGVPAASTPAGPSASVAAVSPAAAAAASAQSAPAAAIPAVPPASPPESFKDGKNETIAAAVGLGCEAKSLDGWLELLCRKRNGTGGHPVRAVFSAGADAEADAGPTNEVLADEKRELRLVVPFRAGEKQSITMEWSDTRYELKIDGASASFDWAGSVVSHRRACQTLLEQNRARIADAQKAEGAARVTPAEAKKLPRFGQCQPAGLGSWALSLTRFEGAGEGALRTLAFAIDAVRVDLEGQLRSAPFGTIEVAPGGLEIASLQVYDYDDDGNNELIVPYEITALAGGKSPALPSPIWTFSASGVAAYAKAPSVSGGFGVEQLDFDMRPDLGGYGPFVAWLGPDCGAKTCPARITGPKFYFHSTPDGAFSVNDAAAQAALARGCSSKSASLVVAGGGGVNPQLTAKNLVCARARGTTVEVLQSELAAKQAELCGGAAGCPLAKAFEAWLTAELPATVPAEPDKGATVGAGR
jgi:hypothetical protein